MSSSFTSKVCGLIATAASSELAVLVLDFCLPASLFIGAASASPSQLEDWHFVVAIAVGLLAIYLAGLVIARVVFRLRVDASALQALNGSFPNMAFMGIPVLTAVTGPSAVLPVVVGNLVSSLVLLPVTLALLEAGKSGNRGHQGLTVIWHAVLDSMRQPLVIAPVVGVVLALLGWHLPEAIHNSFALMGDATSGVALFALRYKVYSSESNATVLLSTVLSIVTLGAAIAMTQ